MNKQRIIITEVKITKAGQINNFQIKLPKNSIAIVGVSTDIRIDKRVSDVAGTVSVAYPVKEKNVEAIKTVVETMALEQTAIKTERGIFGDMLAGRIRLQSLEKANIFYGDYVWAIQFNDGIGDVTDDFYLTDTFSVFQKKEPKKVYVPADTIIINGMYRDLAGASIKRDIAYTIKVLLWVTKEEEETNQEKK